MEKDSILTFLNTVLLRPFEIQVLVLLMHPLGAFVEVVLERRALGRSFAFCDFIN